jgi:hypothetical protein
MRSWRPGAPDDRAFLLHVRDALREVRDFVEGTDYEGFLEDRMMQNAVMRSCEVVGEAGRFCCSTCSPARGVPGICGEGSFGGEEIRFQSIFESGYQRLLAFCASFLRSTAF